MSEAIDIQVWANYFYRTNFTSSKEQLVGIEAGPVSEQSGELLALILNVHDTGVLAGQWSYGEGPYDLLGCVIAHNGANASRFPTSFKYQNVLILELPPTFPVRVTGSNKATRIYLQYN